MANVKLKEFSQIIYDCRCLLTASFSLMYLRKENSVLFEGDFSNVKSGSWAERFMGLIFNSFMEIWDANFFGLCKVDREELLDSIKNYAN